jgi:imidazolonepropionase-like amidohydrolase
MLEQRQGLDGNAAAALRDAQEMAVLQAFDQRICRRVAKSLAASGQVQVPTLVLDYEDSIRRLGYLDGDARMRYLRADERARWDRLVASVASGDHALEKLRWSVARQIVSTFNRSAVPILSGTDAPMPGVYPGFSLHDELALLVQSGLTPRAALRSATLGPAEFLGIAGETGSVEVGKHADLLVLDADPTRDVRNTRRIHALIFDGRLLRRADLDELLEAAARAQAP